MLNLKCRTEYSFRTAYGRPEQVLERGGVGICDRSGTWGHVQFSKAAKKKGIKPVFGVELAVVEDSSIKEKQPVNYMSFLAKTNKGLQEIYELTTLATEQFYYTPRIDYSQLYGLSEEVAILSGAYPNLALLPRVKNMFAELSPIASEVLLEFAIDKNLKTIACSDNFYPSPEDKRIYEIIASGNKENRTSPMHILSEWEWWDALPNAPEISLRNAEELYAECNADLPIAEMVHYTVEKTIEQMCIEGAVKRKIDLTDEKYKARLIRELELIKQKKFEDYFYVISDMVNYAKRHMLVGPARGSSCGSLVCYLVGITDIDPLPYNLLFERFIDINREDLPDIDIDFQDDRRELVFTYLKEKYGADKVARLGTVMRYKAKSAIDDVARELSIPVWEVKDLKDAILERSSGDARAQFCIMDTFESLDIGKKTLEKYPELEAAAFLENHARQSGQHAAGVLVTAEPVYKYCSVDKKTGAAMIDKKDAENLNMLKIDALGLRTLSVIQDALDQIGWTRDQLLNYPLDDKKAFDVILKGRFSGIFQFEGFALQNIARQMPIRKFEDIAAITALARPGPLASGGTGEYVKRHNGEKEIKYIHPLMEEYTKETYGIVIYQETVMQIVRNIGKLSWEDTSTLRKAMSSSLGKEYFDKFKVRFVAGAKENNVPEKDAVEIWEAVNTMGSWAFNASHSIAYGLVSYWCCVLKSGFPLEYAAACLRNSKDEEQVATLIRELVKEGYKYKTFDKDKSVKNWAVVEGELIGGLLNIKGCGEKMADDILKRKAVGVPLTPRQQKLLDSGETPYDHIFEAHEKFSDLYASPEKYNITSDLTEINDITDAEEKEYVVVGKLLTKNLRDLNETIYIQKRQGRVMESHTEFLNFNIGDDSGSMRATIGRYDYQRLGKQIVEEGKIGDWYIFRGNVRKGFMSLNVKKWRKLT